MPGYVHESDWKLFRKRIPVWQEAYMDKLTKKYIELLSSNKQASERFWELDKCIRQDKKDCGVQCTMSRSTMEDVLLSLLSEGAITPEDLDGFSDDLREKLLFIWTRLSTATYHTP